jgi:tRNA nucleotidyltransferase/poly(A) polymerase
VTPLEHAKAIAAAVGDAGGRALVVGGWVRDRLLSLPLPEKSNVDLEVFGVPAETLRALLERFGRVEAVGESFQVYKLGDVDVSLPRRDSKAGRGHRGFVVTGDPQMSIAEAARRRDFTVNAISWDPLSAEYFDPFDGRRDLERRLLRMVDADTFADDSLRVLRAVQLAARFEFTLDRRRRRCAARFRSTISRANASGARSRNCCCRRAVRRSGSPSRWISASSASSFRSFARCPGARRNRSGILRETSGCTRCRSSTRRERESTTCRGRSRSR